MAYCVNCGKQFEEGAKFCTACGAPINGEVKSKVKNESETFSPPVQNADNKEAVSFLSAKKYYIFGALLLVVFVGVFAYISSTPKESANIGMQKFCKAFINGDAEMLKKFDNTDIKDKRPLKERFRKEGIDKLHGTFGSFGVTRLQTETIVDAILNKMLTNNTVSCRLIEQKGKEAKVEVSFNDFDLDNVDDYAMQERLKKRMLPIFTPAKLSTMTKKEFEEEIAKQFTIVMVEMIGEIKPAGKRSFVVNCVYNSKEGVWKPQNFDDFVKQANNVTKL